MKDHRPACHTCGKEISNEEFMYNEGTCDICEWFVNDDYEKGTVGWAQEEIHG